MNSQNNISSAKTIFIFGLGGFGCSRPPVLPDFVKYRINELIATKKSILVGDCQGIDALVQSHLKSKGYDDVTVYYSGSKYRNKLDPNWKSASIPSNARGRAFYTAKDICACNDADAGLAVWDGVSMGTGRNIYQLKEAGKPVEVYRIDLNRFEPYYFESHQFD